MQAKADALLSQAVERGAVPGVVAGATDREHTTYLGAFGKRAQGQPDAMAPDSVVWLASMTKPITGAAAMQQVERGKLDLDLPARKILPELGSVQVLEGFDAAGKPRLRAPIRDITLRHLLTHTSGFSYDIWSPDIGRYQQVMGLPSINSCEDAALSTPLRFDPGTRWDYGIGIDWAGKMVEAVSGQKLGEYFRDHLLGPLGMQDTGFFVTPAMRERLATVHRREASGALSPDPEFGVPQEPEFEMGGGGLYGTVPDYLRFVRMMLDQGRSERGDAVLAPETVARMSRNAMGNIEVEPLVSAVPELSNDAEFFPGIQKQWGLSFMINNAVAPTGRSAGSLAWAGLANTYFWIDPGRELAGVYATQILPFGDRESLPLYLAFEQAVYEG